MIMCKTFEINFSISRFCIHSMNCDMVQKSPCITYKGFQTKKTTDLIWNLEFHADTAAIFSQ